MGMASARFSAAPCWMAHALTFCRMKGMPPDSRRRAYFLATHMCSYTCFLSRYGDGGNDTDCLLWQTPAGSKDAAQQSYCNRIHMTFPRPSGFPVPSAHPGARVLPAATGKDLMALLPLLAGSNVTGLLGSFLG